MVKISKKMMREAVRHTGETIEHLKTSKRIYATKTENSIDGSNASESEVVIELNAKFIIEIEEWLRIQETATVKR